MLIYQIILSFYGYILGSYFNIHFYPNHSMYKFFFFKYFHQETFFYIIFKGLIIFYFYSYTHFNFIWLEVLLLELLN